MKDLHTIDTYPLFELMEQEHGISLTEGELYDIIRVVITQADKADALLPGVVAFSLDNGRTEGTEFIVRDITATVARQAVNAEAERYVVTIQEDGMGEGVEIGTVAEVRDALPLVRAIAQIIENE